MLKRWAGHCQVSVRDKQGRSRVEGSTKALFYRRLDELALATGQEKANTGGHNSAVPSGLMSVGGRVPNVETLGYCQVSLRDKHGRSRVEGFTKALYFRDGENGEKFVVVRWSIVAFAATITVTSIKPSNALGLESHPFPLAIGTRSDILIPRAFSAMSPEYRPCRERASVSMEENVSLSCAVVSVRPPE